jgi:uncharacterized membrane protein YeaQ/YmgE (transglycosylase-associated protein family)
MLAFIGFLILGLVAGLLARAILPGRDPMSLLATTVLGCVGALVGGFVGKALFNDSDGAGIVLATLGAILVLFIYRAATRDRGGVRV